jgi:type II secretory ATPase GspE/PulE/Tfp pilus assembly ATPase PilB-like protein
MYNFGADEVPADQQEAEKMAKDVSVIKLVNDIIEKALLSGASDVHIEPTRNRVVVRYRVDGLLRKVNSLPKVLLPSVVARIKILTNLKIDEHMVPQDGRFRFKYQEREVALRVSIIPTLNGPKAVMRLLDSSKQLLNLSKLGLNAVHMDIMKKEIESPQGMILVTGPTGSGKTTTLYTLLDILNREDVNICTIEDPIEYDLGNVSQMQVNSRVGLTFAQGLRSLMRQDPNIIMVGEIRDYETAEIVMNAAMTGHLVLSTLHTNSAFLAPQRLMEMGVAPYMVSSVSNLIIGQRLVRRLCPDCRVRLRLNEKALDEYESKLDIKRSITKLKKLGLIPEGQNLSDLTMYRPKGCRKCNHSGYKGRIGIYEVIPFDDKLSELVLAKGSESAIRQLMEDKVVNMTEDGILKVINGISTFDEVVRVTRE